MGISFKGTRSIIIFSAPQKREEEYHEFEQEKSKKNQGPNPFYCVDDIGPYEI